MNVNLDVHKLQDMKKSHLDFFSEALNLTKKSGHPKFQHGSIVVHRNSIVGRGANFGFTHAEVSSIQNCNHRHITSRDRLVVFVCRVNSRGVFMNSRPCDRCQTYMRRKGIHKVYFTLDDTEVGKITFSESGRQNSLKKGAQ